MGAKDDWLRDLTPEFDYLKIMSILAEYRSPRDQITRLMKQKKIIRVKKGTYVLGPEFRKPYAREILANMIYGPSYVSGISALHFYQFIPERTEVVFSRTPNRNKQFDTPVGRFVYRYCSMERYQVSIRRAVVDNQRSFLIASREKAVVETIAEVDEINSCEDLRDWMDSMRIDSDSLRTLRLSELNVLKKLFPADQIGYLTEIVREAKR